MKKILIEGMIFMLAIILIGLPSSLASTTELIEDITVSKYIKTIGESAKCKIPLFYLRPGDLLFFDIKQSLKDLFDKPMGLSGFSNDHVAMYIGGGRFIESSDYSPFGFCKYLGGVQITPWWFFHLYANRSTITIGKVNASSGQKLRAILFAMKQISEPYQHGWPNYTHYHSWHANPDITDPNNPFYELYYYPDDPYVNYWYCGELLWAAYLHQGINLGPTTPDPAGDGVHYCVIPEYIRNSDNITMFPYN